MSLLPKFLTHAKYKTRYHRVNGGLVLMRRAWYGRWVKYQPYENLEFSKELELNKHAKALQKTFDELQELKRIKKKIGKDINDARDEPEGYAYPVEMTLPIFPRREKRINQPDSYWHRFLHALRGAASSFGEAASMVYGPNQKADDDVEEGDFVEVTGQQVMNVNRRGNQNNQNNNNNQKQKGGNQNNRTGGW